MVEIGVPPWLEQVGRHGPTVDGRHNVGGGRTATHADPHDVGMAAADPLQQLHAGQPGHAVVGKDNVGRQPAVQQPDGQGARLGDGDGEAPVHEHPLQGPQHKVIVVHQQGLQGRPKMAGERCLCGIHGGTTFKGHRPNLDRPERSTGAAPISGPGTRRARRRRQRRAIRGPHRAQGRSRHPRRRRRGRPDTTS